MFDTTNLENIKKAKEAITPILDTLKLCGSQNISLIDHKNSMKDYPEVGKCGLTNSGNLVELLRYRVRGGKLIKCSRDLIVKQLVEEVKGSRNYSILADEATDCSMKEQSALVFRFSEKKKNIREEFVSFLESS